MASDISSDSFFLTAYIAHAFYNKNRDTVCVRKRTNVKAICSFSLRIYHAHRSFQVGEQFIIYDISRGSEKFNLCFGSTSLYLGIHCIRCMHIQIQRYVVDTSWRNKYRQIQVSTDYCTIAVLCNLVQTFPLQI